MPVTTVDHSHASDAVSHASDAVKHHSGNDSNVDRRYNIGIFGIPDSASGSARVGRLKEDWDRVAKIIQDLDTDIPSQSIRDCFCLGKFIENSRGRPMLVKLHEQDN